MFFSDIEGSTSLWETDPDGMGEALAHHDELVRRIVSEAGGCVFKHTGDGFGAAFESASGELRAALDISAALVNEPWKGPRLACRFGVHSGEVEPRGGDYFGATVTRAARIMGAGNGGQIVVSAAARKLVGDSPENALLIDAGENRLKDLGSRSDYSGWSVRAPTTSDRSAPSGPRLTTSCRIRSRPCSVGWRCSGDTRFEGLLREGRSMPWEDLPLVGDL